MELPQKNDVASLVELRAYKPEDKAFIIATWLRGYYYGEKSIGEIDKQAFMSAYNLRLNALLDSGKLDVRIMCLKEDHEVILAYAVLSKSGEALHWIFTKSAWRKTGLAKSLVPVTINSVSHLTSVGRSILKKYKEIIKYNPFLL